MKILFLGNGVSVHIHRWVSAMAERGHDVHLAHCANNALPKGVADGRVTAHPLPFPTPYGYYLNGPALRALARKIRPDICNAHYATGYGTLARQAGLHPLVLSVWGSDIYDYPEKSGRARRMVVKNLEHSDRIASTSLVMADRTRGLGARLKGEIAITPFGVDPQRYAAPNANAREDGGGPLIVGTVKTLKPKYGIDTLLRAFARAKELAALPIRLRIYGSGPEEESLKALARELGIGEDVLWGGFIDNRLVPDALREMHIFAAFSRLDSESFGVAAVEAMAAGLPVVASTAPGFTEVVEQGVCGLLAQPDDVEAHAKNIAALLTDREARLRMGEEGRRRVRRLYVWDDNVRAMEALYEETIREFS